MSSSDDGLRWDALARRPAGRDVDLLSPAAEIAATIQRCSADLARAREDAAGVERELVAALAEQAVYAARLGAALAAYEQALGERVHRHLRILKDQMLAVLAAAGIEVVPLLGLPWDAVADETHVDGWRQRPDLTEEVVVEELEPTVRRGGAVVRMGRVVMGTPATAAGQETE